MGFGKSVILRNKQQHCIRTQLPPPQLMLKRVLLAYARWNKSIGYCQGFNMLAAIILEVMDKSESHALKVRVT